MLTSSYTSFFKDLAANNTTEWFNLNKKGYENDVKKPFESLIAALIEEMHRITPEIQISPKDAIFRINRDIRFSSDKSPYKTEMSAVIAKQGKKSNPCPGLYLSLGAEKATLASGLKMLDKEQLTDIRFYIADNLDRFHAIIQDADFTAAFGHISGERVKRLPQELKQAADKQPLLFNTSFIASVDLPAAASIKPDFTRRVIDLYKLTLPLSAFFNVPLKS